MTTNRTQVLEVAYVVALIEPRRRSLPTRPRTSLSQPLHKRWRERPHSRAVPLTPACRDGSFTPSRAVPFVVVHMRHSCAGESRPDMHRGARPELTVARVPTCSAGIGSCTSRVLRQGPWGAVARSNGTTIASMMLAPCSGSSMLSASLRPGPWPGLRALTTPARGSHWQLRDGGHRMTVHNDVDPNTMRAYVDLITSVPHGTPPVRHTGIRSAHSAGASRARFGAHPLQPSQPFAEQPRAVDLHTAGCELECLSRRRVFRTARQQGGSVRQAVIAPWFS